MHPLLAPYAQALEEIAAAGLHRACPTLSDPAARRATCNGLPVVNFCSNNYLGLAQDSRLQAAALEATRRHGTGSGAARLVCGTSEAHAELEAAVAAYKGTEAALVFNSGYQANVGILQALLEPGDSVFCDKLNHASLVDGCRLSGAQWRRYRHNDLKHLEGLLQRRSPGKCWIVTDSLFSMDGDAADLPGLVALAERYEALLLVDEAHASGIFGPTRSSGLTEASGVTAQVALQMGTFSKALGGFGAYVAGPRVLIDYLTNRARSFIYSTALPPGVIAAAREALNVVQTDPVPKKRLWENVAHFQPLIQPLWENLEAQGIKQQPSNSQIFPLILGAHTLAVSERLRQAGYFVQAIRPPTVPTARLRITLSAHHQPEDLVGLAEALRRACDAAFKDGL